MFWQWLRYGAQLGVVGFAAVTVFLLLWVGALAVMALIGWIIKWIGR